MVNINTKPHPKTKNKSNTLKTVNKLKVKTKNVNVNMTIPKSYKQKYEQKSFIHKILFKIVFIVVAVLSGYKSIRSLNEYYNSIQNSLPEHQRKSVYIIIHKIIDRFTGLNGEQFSFYKNAQLLVNVSVLFDLVFNTYNRLMHLTESDLQKIINERIALLVVNKTIDSLFPPKKIY